jgi:hypothetical protein
VDDMTSADPAWKPDWHSVRVGEVLPSVTYTLDRDKVEAYRALVENPTAAYPTVAARHPAMAFHERYRGQMRLPNMGYESQYFSPPEPGSVITVTALVVDKYVKRDRKFLVVEARAVDDQGRLIQIDRVIGMVARVDEPAFDAVGQKWEKK